MTMCWLFGHHWHAALVLRPEFVATADKRPGAFNVFTEADLIREPARCLHCGKVRGQRSATAVSDD